MRPTDAGPIVHTIRVRRGCGGGGSGAISDDVQDGGSSSLFA